MMEARREVEVCEETEEMDASCEDYDGLSNKYASACERHGISPHSAVFSAFDKGQKQTLELLLDQIPETDMEPLIEMLSAVESSDLDAVDVVFSNTMSNLRWPLLVQVMRAAGSKLRMADLSDSVLGREAVRELFHGGINCEVMHLSFCHVRRLEMSGHFPSLHTLKLDCIPVTCLPEGCFLAMPKLEKLSMCGTSITNLWTTSTALRRLSALRELRFQKCMCCQGTGPCGAQTDDAGHSNEGGVERIQREEYELHNGSDFSDDLEHSFTFSEPEDNQFSGAWSAEDSDAEQVGPTLRQDVEGENPAYDQDFVEDIINEDTVANEELRSASAHLVTLYQEAIGGNYGRHALLNFIDLDDSSISPEGENLYDGVELETDTSMVEAPERMEGANTDGGEEEAPGSSSVLFPRVAPGADLVSPICDEKGYREFMLTTLPALEVLDNVAVTEAERERARYVFEEQFEPLANGRRKESVLQILKRRETGGAPRLGYIIDKERSPAAYTRSLSAAKMGSNAWPATKTVCRVKIPNFEGGRRCRPRQFEYHPTEPSYMVFGTLQGEVVVINHESDKVVGYVQSIGAPHSILGLCWLNKDPNKLIAGSDNGSLQLYDVNHMRASMISAASRSGSRYRNENNWGRQYGSRSPTLYTYDDFEQLTSVHINSTDEYFVASGYSNHVGLYDLHTGARLQVFSDLHKEHINVVKFANHSPHIFATSSFDKEIKMWDLRQKVTQPLYTVRSNRGNVMVCFSRDDHYLLSSAVDNEVRQYLAADGRLHLQFDIPPMSSSLNYTRSYYLNGRDYIISGSCEENVVRVCCAQTGRRLRDLTVEGRGLRNSLYVQSLRGDPFKDFHFCMLVAYNHPQSRSEIVKVNFLGGESQGEDHEFQPQQMPLSGLGA